LISLADNLMNQVTFLALLHILGRIKGEFKIAKDFLHSAFSGFFILLLSQLFPQYLWIVVDIISTKNHLHCWNDSSNLLLLKLFTLKLNLNVIFAHGFAVIFSAVALPVV